MNLNKRFSKNFQKQFDCSDCGVACLASIINYYGGKINLEQLRELSGTTKQGTTLLGLFQSAQKIGLDVEGLEADLEWLKRIDSPVILHVLIDDRLQHYIVCYGYQNRKFIIGDPAIGIIEYDSIELERIWKSKALLKLKPNRNFKIKQQIKKEKLKWFKTLIKEDLDLLSILFVLSLILSILGLSMAVFSQKLVDDILPSRNIDKLVLGLSLLFFLLLMRSWLGYVSGFFGIRQSKDFNNRLIGHFYHHLIYLPKSFFDHRRIGELVARMNDTSRIQSAIIQVFIELLNKVLIVLVCFVLLFIYSPEIGYIPLLSLPVYGFISYCYHKKIVIGQKEIMAAEAHKSSNYVNTMQGIDTVKACHKEEIFAEINRYIYGDLQEKVFTLGRTSIRLQVVIEIVNVFFSIGLLGIGSWLVFSQNMTIGSLMAILGITTVFFPAIASLSFANIYLQGAKVAFDRMFEFTSIDTEFSQATNSEINYKIDFKTLELKDLSFRFPGRKQILKKINLHLKKNEIVAILGENGGGKSTLLNILQSFYEIEQGEIKINNQNLCDIPKPLFRDSIGVVPQHVSVFNGTLIENLIFGAENSSPKTCMEFCKETGFEKYFTSFPQGYETLLGEEGINISGGQRQLIGLCRALLKQPSLLLFDEPTAAMDMDTENFVLSAINQYRHRCGVLLVTHQLKLANMADKVYILQSGVIQVCGSQKELLESDNLYSQLYNEILKIPVT